MNLGQKMTSLQANYIANYPTHKKYSSALIFAILANFTLFLYMLQWRETRVAKIKIANLAKNT